MTEDQKKIEEVRGNLWDIFDAILEKYVESDVEKYMYYSAIQQQTQHLFRIANKKES